MTKKRETKGRVNWTDMAQANAEFIAAECGSTLSEAAEYAGEFARLNLRHPVSARTVDVDFHRETLSEEARRMLEIARAQGVLVGESSITIWDNDDLGLDDTLRVRVRSLLSYEERARKLGIAGLDMSQVERDADGKPIYFVGIGGAPIPTKKYLENLRQFYGNALDTSKAWEVPTEVVKQVRDGKLVGNAAIEEIARQFWAWCAEGDFEPVNGNYK